MFVKETKVKCGKSNESDVDGDDVQTAGVVDGIKRQ